MLHTFGAEQGIGEFLHRAGFSFHHHYLQAVVMIQMHVHGGKDVVKVGVLKISELLVQQPDVMIVDQCDGADHVGSSAGERRAAHDRRGCSTPHEDWGKLESTERGRP